MNAFHRTVLPVPLEHLQDKYGIAIEPEVFVRHLLPATKHINQMMQVPKSAATVRDQHLQGGNWIRLVRQVPRLVHVHGCYSDMQWYMINHDEIIRYCNSHIVISYYHKRTCMSVLTVVAVANPSAFPLLWKKGTRMGQCAELRKLKKNCELPNSVFADVEDLLWSVCQYACAISLFLFHGNIKSIKVNTWWSADMNRQKWRALSNRAESSGELPVSLITNRISLTDLCVRMQIDQLTADSVRFKQHWIKSN